jgi:hypothetical protein
MAWRVLSTPPVAVLRRRWSRRTFLRAAGISASAGAFASLMPRSTVEAAPGPKRIVLITSGQGTDMTRWRPSGGETDFTLSTLLDPFERYRDRLLVLDGIDNEAAYHGVADGHFGMSTLWTGVPIPPGTVREEGVGWPQAPSVERLIAARVGTETRFDAFYWGTWPASLSGGNQGPNGIAYHRGPDQPIEPVLSPDRAFDRLFDGVTGDTAAIEKLRAERRSVLDLVRGELGRLRTELPEADRDRMDAHLAGVRSLEERLADLRPVCIVPERPVAYSESNERDFALHPQTTRLQFELMALALACDLTRVAAFQWPHSEGRGSFMAAEGYRDFGSFHTIAHEMSYETVDDVAVTDEQRRIAREDMANLTRWRSEMIASHLLDRMLPDVLANTIVVWASEMSEGGTHSNRNVPVVMVQGSDFGAFRAGRYLRWGEFDPLGNARMYTGGQPMQKVLVSLCHAMGLPEVTSVGDASISEGPLEALL